MTHNELVRKVELHNEQLELLLRITEQQNETINLLQQQIDYFTNPPIIIKDYFGNPIFNPE